MKPYTLITGASSGIGKHLAIRRALLGHPLILVALPGTHLEFIAGLIANRYDVEVHVFETDLTLNGEPERLFRWTQDSGFTIDFLINNAGVGYEGHFEKLNPEFCRTLMTLNMQVVVIMTRLFMAVMRDLPSAQIMNISSLASFAPVPFKSLYAASKSFIYSFSVALNAEMRGSGLKVSVMCPGPVPTTESTRRRIARHRFFSRLTVMQPSDVARSCLNRYAQGDTTIIPGFMNRVVRLFMRLFPISLQLELICAGMKRKQHA